MPLLSVIIPTYNRGYQMARGLENYLSALRLGAKATGASFECILVDDHSIDGSFDQLQVQFGQTEGVQLLRMPVNSGPGPARDAGVVVAQGTWIWFLDDDDALDPIHIPALFAALLQAPVGLDVVSHSLKNTYLAVPERTGLELAQRVMAFREFQEVFRHVVRKDLMTRNNIRFSQGLHEDIRYVIELMLRAGGVRTLALSITMKLQTDNAITARMSTRRIDGYVQAYNETRTLLEGSALGTPRLLQLFLVQSLGVLLLLITREPEEALSRCFLEHLRLCSQGSHAWSRDVAQLTTFGPRATNLAYAGSLWRAHPRSTTDTDILASLREVFSTRLSCKDLDASLFLGPDEIRACCKRFFVNGIRKGDVVLLKADALVDLPRIQTAKRELIDRINADSAPECSGCPYIERRPVHRGGIDYLSLENFAYCNMQCTYCSPKYYGGTEAKYNAATVVEQVAQLSGGFDANCHVVWGGGEPTLSPRFADINRSLTAMPQSGKIRVLSNSLKYSEKLESQLHDPRFHLVTSIDAGTEETFKSLRGKSGLNDVLANLVRYQKVLDDPRRLTVKYIVGVGNYSSHELQAYVEKLAGSPLLNSLFQVSCDFTLDAPEDGLICALYELSLRLLSQGARFVFFDDLVRDRVRMTAARAQMVRLHLAKHHIDEQHLWTPEGRAPVVLWGTGKQAEWLTLHTLTGMAGRILGAAQDDQDYRKLSANQPGIESANDNLAAIFPAGVQSLYDIIRNIERAGRGAQMVRGVML